MRFSIVFVIVAAWAAPAWACSRNVLALTLPTRVPADGVVSLWDCYFPEECGAYPSPIVRDASGQLVAGTTRQGVNEAGRAVWVPDAPLTVGARYSLTLDPEVVSAVGTVYAKEENSFEVVAGLPSFAAGEQRVDASLSIEYVTLERVCCPDGERTSNTCSIEPKCKPSRAAPKVHLLLGLEGFDDLRGQWSFAARVAGAATDEPFSYPYTNFARIEIEDYRGRACFSLIARSLRDDSETTAYESCIEQPMELPPEVISSQKANDAFLRTCRSFDAGVVADASAPFMRDASVDEPPRGDDGCQLGSRDSKRGALTMLVMIGMLMTRRRRLSCAS